MTIIFCSKKFDASTKVELVKAFKSYVIQLVKDWLEDDWEDSKFDELDSVREKKIKDFDKETLEWVGLGSYFHKFVIEKLQSKKKSLDTTLEKLSWKEASEFLNDYIKDNVIWVGDEDQEEGNKLDFAEDYERYEYAVAFAVENEEGSGLMYSGNFLNANDLVFSDQKEFGNENDAIAWLKDQDSDYAYAVKVKDPKAKQGWYWLVGGNFEL